MISRSGERLACVGREGRAEVVLFRAETELVSWPLWVDDGRVDLSVVETVARWQLEARRRGCSVRLRRACPEVLQLLDLVGLSNVMDLVAERPLVEVVGEAEGGEEPGVEEVVVTDDPVA